MVLVPGDVGRGSAVSPRRLLCPRACGVVDAMVPEDAHAETGEALGTGGTRRVEGGAVHSHTGTTCAAETVPGKADANSSCL